MGERLTIEEIRERYDGEWVLLTEMQEDAVGETLSGVVAAHGPERDEVYEKIASLRLPRRFETLCLKELPEGWGMAL